MKWYTDVRVIALTSHENLYALSMYDQLAGGETIIFRHGLKEKQTLVWGVQHGTNLVRYKYKESLLETNLIGCPGQRSMKKFWDSLSYPVFHQHH
jgi:hypothetical protein